MTKKLKELLLEISMPKILYHGRNVKNLKFDLKKIGGKNANDQDGPGFYFTDLESDARSYAVPKGIIMTVKHSLNNLIYERAPLNSKQRKAALQLIDMAPNMDDVLADWGYDPGWSSRQDALDQMLDTLIRDSDAKDTFLSIWYDLYHRDRKDVLYIKNCVKLGIDGIVTKAGPATHVIVYNIKKVKLVSVEEYKAMG